MEHDNENVRQDKFALFWTVYCIDKSLSLRLGRAATIQDYDVSVPMVMNISGVTEPWKTIYHLWIHYARAQGRVYEKLYSQMALNQPEEHRASQARKLASELQWIVMKPHKVWPGHLVFLAIELTVISKGDDRSTESIFV